MHFTEFLFGQAGLGLERMLYSVPQTAFFISTFIDRDELDGLCSQILSLHTEPV